MGHPVVHTTIETVTLKSITKFFIEDQTVLKKVESMRESMLNIVSNNRLPNSDFYVIFLSFFDEFFKIYL